MKLKDEKKQKDNYKNKENLDEFLEDNFDTKKSVSFSFNKKIDLLNKYIIKNNYELDGNVQIARYDPPWTLPFLRRNELLIKIK